jgi:Anthrone oxygenase
MAARRHASQPDRDTARGTAVAAVITVSEFVLKWIQFVSIMLYVLVAGVMWGTWLSLARTMTNYDAATFLSDGKHMIENLAMIMAVLMICAVVIELVAVVLLFRSRSAVAAWLAAIGLLLMMAVMVITLAVEVPIDNVIGTWTEATLPPNWQEIRARWSAFHTVRTFLSLGAVAAAVGAGLTTRTAAPGRSLSAAGAPVARDHALPLQEQR